MLAIAFTVRIITSRRGSRSISLRSASRSGPHQFTTAVPCGDPVVVGGQLSNIIPTPPPGVHPFGAQKGTPQVSVGGFQYWTVAQSGVTKVPDGLKYKPLVPLGICAEPVEVMPESVQIAGAAAALYATSSAFQLVDVAIVVCVLMLPGPAAFR